MKTDRYTKTVLTVIAACLVVHTLKSVNIIPEAHAAEPASKATAALPETAKYGLVPVNADGSINVKLTNTAPMEVKIVDISSYNEMPVNIKEIAGYSVYNGVIPVKVKE